MNLSAETIRQERQAERAYIEEQVAVVQAGNAEAFAEVYPRILPGIVASLARLANSEIAADSAHVGIARAYERIGAYEQKPGKSFESWTLTIARNAMIDNWRQRERAGTPVDDETLTMLMPAAQNDTASEALESDATSRIDALFDRAKLTEKQKTVILLFHVDGLSYKEIASQLDIPVNSVPSIMVKGFNKIRETHSITTYGKRGSETRARVIDLFAEPDYSGEEAA